MDQEPRQDSSRDGRRDSRQEEPDRVSRRQTEDMYWQKRRDMRDRYASRGVREVWSKSPSHDELKRVYEEHDEAEKQAAQEAAEADIIEQERLKKAKKAAKKEKKILESGLSPESYRHKKKKSKKDKNDRSEKKSKKRKRASSSDKHKDTFTLPRKKKDTFILPLNKEQFQVEEIRKVQISTSSLPKVQIQSSSTHFDGKLDSKARQNMRSGEANALSAYVAEGKRIPRRGEIGLSSDDISTFEKAGYIMSGSRHHTMEATRVRKETQIMTAEEQKLLRGYTQIQRLQKEETIMKQFEKLLSSRKG